MKSRIKVWLGLIMCGLLLAGCAEKLTFERWQTIHDGMHSDAVTATLGEPWQTTEQTWIYSDENRGVTAMVYFRDDAVIGKTWQSPEHGTQGTSPNVNQPGESEEIRVRTIK
ncbi:MAG: hypothetical protein GXY55_11250 [Phycisphaerae bacterium]|nr:hypothetical protein [Phycisphaerae bacterium]